MSSSISIAVSFVTDPTPIHFPSSPPPPPPASPFTPRCQYSVDLTHRLNIARVFRPSANSINACKCILQIVSQPQNHLSDAKSTNVCRTFECLKCILATVCGRGFAMEFVVTCRKLIELVKYTCNECFVEISVGLRQSRTYASSGYVTRMNWRAYL